MANFVDFTPVFGSIRTAVSNTQNPTHTHSRLSAAHTITMSLFYQTITVRQYPAAGSDLCEGGILKAFVTLARRPGVETMG